MINIGSGEITALVGENEKCVSVLFSNAALKWEFNIKEKFMGRTNRKLSIDTTRTAWKTKQNKGEHRQQGDLINFLTKIRMRYTDT
jgi:hypothetical protein